MPLDALQFIVYSRRKGLYVPINHTTVVAILLFSLIFFFLSRPLGRNRLGRQEEVVFPAYLVPLPLGLGQSQDNIETTI